jgi:hypothetical protein
VPSTLCPQRVISELIPGFPQTSLKIKRHFGKSQMEKIKIS